MEKTFAFTLPVAHLHAFLTSRVWGKCYRIINPATYVLVRVRFVAKADQELSGGTSEFHSLVVVHLDETDSRCLAA